MIDQSRLYSLYDSEPSAEVAFLRFLARSYSLPDPPSVLDVGCGTGRMLRPLDELGWRVAGLEPDPDYAAAAERCARTLSNTTVRQGGFAEVGEDGATYDLIAAVNGPYSYLRGYEARREAIERCASALRSGGVLFLHYSNFWWILRNYREPPEREMEIDGTTVTRTAFHDIDFHAGRFTHNDVFRWTEPGGESRTVTKKHEMTMSGPPEVERLFREADLEDVRTFNDYADRETAPLCGQRILISARKRG